MSLFALAAGTLIAEPQRRHGAKSSFTTATLRVSTGSGGETTLVNVVAFGTLADDLAGCHERAAIAISGRAELRSWTGRDGKERTGLSLVAEQIASTASLRRRERKAESRLAAEPARAAAVAPLDNPFDDPLGDLYPGDGR